MADDNKPMKYARYAIGEILLVVIGILIALQINNWNEYRKGKATEMQLLSALKTDFLETRTRLGETITLQRTVISYSRQLLILYENNKLVSNKRFEEENKLWVVNMELSLIIVLPLFQQVH